MEGISTLILRMESKKLVMGEVSQILRRGIQEFGYGFTSEVPNWIGGMKAQLENSAN